jgi:hypothetical protein
MKKILFLAVWLCTTIAHAQNFEGIVKWSFTTEVTDPATKAKMEEAQKKMKDPANQAKMKEMQAKMNDPQFKKMMEANPQMKAQMEAMMKMSESGDMSSMMPKSFEIRIKNSNTLSKMEGGIMDKMEILSLKDKNLSYRIDRVSKTYSVLPSADSIKQMKDMETKVTKTSETMKILNYTCTKYIVEYTTHGKKVDQILWTTTEIKDFDMKSLAHQGGGNGQHFYFDKVDGVPLKMEMTMPEGKMVMQVTEIKRQSLPATAFQLPPDYKEVKSSFSR